MENVENTAAAEAVVEMEVEENSQEQPEIGADELFDNLMQENPPEEETPPEAEQTAQEEQKEEELTPEQAREQSIKNELQELFVDGWTSEELLAFSRDRGVREDIQAGKSVSRAAAAYERRRRNNAAESKQETKKGVPTLKSSATANAKDASRISEMSDAQFAELSKRAREAMLEGKLVSFK